MIPFNFSTDEGKTKYLHIISPYLNERRFPHFEGNIDLTLTGFRDGTAERFTYRLFALLQRKSTSEKRTRTTKKPSELKIWPLTRRKTLRVSFFGLLTSWGTLTWLSHFTCRTVRSWHEHSFGCLDIFSGLLLCVHRYPSAEIDVCRVQ